MSETQSNSSQPASFEEALTELELLVRKMDQPEAKLDAMLADYKRGAQLVKYCRDRLNVVRQEVAEVDKSLKQEDAT